MLEPVKSEYKDIYNSDLLPVDNVGNADEEADNVEQLLHSLGNTVNNTNSDGAIFTAPLLSVGEVIADRYKIIDVISRGSMGLVYRANDSKFNRTVAIKVSLPDKPLDDEAQRRFKRETEIVGKLDHANIVSVHDAGVLENGLLYLVMEYIEGQTLTDLLKTNKKLDIDTAVQLFRQISTALEYAHGKDIIHRDLKPSNIMIITDSRGKRSAKVIDFSIAKFTKPKPDDNTISRPGDIFGSPLYMSPEQCQAKDLDQRSDIYSLGCVMYEALCGVPPIMGSNAMVTIYMHVHSWPTLPSKIIKDPPLPLYLEAIVVRCIVKDPDQRFQSATELLEELECFCNSDKKKTAQDGWLKQLSAAFSKKKGAVKT